MSLCEDLIDKYNDELNSIPSIQYIWTESQSFVDSGDEKMIKKFEGLIYKLHNSFVSPYTRFGKGIKFGYGGIGVVVHRNCVIGDNVTISQNVTLGGTPGSSAYDDNGQVFYVPHIKDNVYIACGSKVLGAVKIGSYSVVGANSVVVKDVDDFSVYAGNPAKKIKKISKVNCLKYKGFFSASAHMTNEEFRSIFPDDFHNE